jgi:hypothetical protein
MDTDDESKTAPEHSRIQDEAKRGTREDEESLSGSGGAHNNGKYKHTELSHPSCLDDAR